MANASDDAERLSHLTGSAAQREARMVDVGDKPVTERAAVARARMGQMCERREPGRFCSVQADELSLAQYVEPTN